MEKPCKIEPEPSSSSGIVIPTGKRSQKKKLDSEKNEKKRKYSNILFSCITVRQLRSLLNKVENDNANSSSSSGMKQETDGDMDSKMVDRGEVRRLVASRTKHAKVIRRNLCQRLEHMPKIAGEQQPIPWAVRMKTFPVASISMGLFIVGDFGNANNQISGANCTVTFCFFSQYIRYDFSYFLGNVSYRAGYRISFSHLHAIIFQGNYISIKLLQPAEQEYCNREVFVENIRTVVQCNDFDVTSGQFKMSLVHVIRTDKDESPIWIFHLLQANREIFLPLIKKSPTVSTDCIHRPRISMPFPVDPGSAPPLYEMNQHPQYFGETKFVPVQKLLPLPPPPPPPSLPPPPPLLQSAQPYMPVQGNNNNNNNNDMNCDMMGQQYVGTSCSAFMSYPSQAVSAYNGNDENAWQQHPGMFVPVQSRICSVAPQHAAMQSEIVDNEKCGQKPADAVAGSSGLMMTEHYDEGATEQGTSKIINGPDTVNSMYVLSGPEMVNSEYAPQESDSQYILSDLDMLFP